MKKTLAVVGAVALAGVLSVTAAGCSRTTRNLASLSSNWYYDNGFKRIQPTFTEEAAERLTYTVVQRTGESQNSYYSAEYADGKYTTEFYAKKITATELAGITLEDWREDYTKAFGADGYMYVYYYATELSIPSVTFTCNGESATFTGQSVKTESYFLSVEDYLRPVYSFKTVNQALPTNIQPSSLSKAYSQVNMTYESFYSLSGNNVYTEITGTSTTVNGEVQDESDTLSIGGLDDYDNSIFDVAYLDIVARAMRNISGTFSQTIGIYTPGLQLRDYTIASTDMPLFDDAEQSAVQLAIIEAMLKSKGLFTPKPVDKNDPEKGNTTLQTASVSIAYNGGNYSGVSQTYWFAVGDGNETRTLMLKYSEPIAYNLGTLDYVLTGIENIG